jgi:SOS response associated peptidase (SRAP)
MKRFPIFFAFLVSFLINSNAGPGGKLEVFGGSTVISVHATGPSFTTKTSDRQIKIAYSLSRKDGSRSSPPRSATRRRIPADGFYEWRTIGGAKIPFSIGMEDDRPFVFAGLWEGWKDPGDRRVGADLHDNHWRSE